jgi:hypothetical protein
MEVSGQLHALAAFLIGGCVGPRVGLDAMKKRKILPLPEIEPGSVFVGGRN